MTTRHMFLPRRECGIVLAAALLVACGCGRSEKPCPVSGQVLVNERPAGGVYVVFHRIDDPEAGRTPDSTRTGKDGSFSLMVHGPGEYAVTAFMPRVTVEAGETIEGEDVFKGKYRAPQQPVLKVTVQDGENQLPPIKLSSP